LLALCFTASAWAIDPPIPMPAEPTPDILKQVVIEGPEPQFVAPTRRDRIGRIWAPVLIDNKGPFRLALDSGASSSGINLAVANALGLPPNQSRQVRLQGVTGSAAVPTVRVSTFAVGDLELGRADLPVMSDALGGADGILGTDRMSGRRIFIDFQHDLITITRSHGERAPAGFMTIPFHIERGNLLVVDAMIGNIPIKAIIDTGGQVTIANLALRHALERRREQLKTLPRDIVDVNSDVQSGDYATTPPLRMAALEPRDSVLIHYADVTYGDMSIFEHWHMTSDPAILVAMDALGLVDTLIIDYRRNELQIRTRASE